MRGSLVYRAFCRIDCERVPDAKTLIRLAGLIALPADRSGRPADPNRRPPCPSLARDPATGPSTPAFNIRSRPELFWDWG